MQFTVSLAGHRLIFSIIVLMLSCFWLQAISFAQTQTTGAIQGIVYESGGRAVIERAVITVTNEESGLVRTTLTNAQGNYFIGLLPPGIYTISATRDGYEAEKDSATNHFPIRLSKTNLVQPPPIVLRKAGSAAASAPVTSPVNAAVGDDSEVERLVNTVNGARGGNFDKRQLVALPLPGVRTFETLAFLLPGVTLPPQTLGGVVGPGIGAGIGTSGQFSVNGSRSRSNNFTVDGSDNNDEDIGVRRQGFVSLIPQSIESVQEFQIFTHLWDAGNGRNTGSQINAISQSGTNLIHGSAYGFFNHHALNARNFFDYSADTQSFPLEARTFARNTGTSDCLPGGVKTSDGCSYTASLVDGTTGTLTPITLANPSEKENPFKRLQGGFTLGGPFSRKFFGPLGHAGENRTFFFTSFERQYIRARRETHFAVPTVAERGFLGSGASGFRIPGLPTLTVAVAVQQNPNGNCQGQNPSSPTGICPASRAAVIKPTFPAGDSVFSLFPFPNNPVGPYGGNTWSQVLRTNGDGSVFSFKFDHNFKLFGERASTFTARYNFTQDEREIPAVGNAIYAAIAPRVGTQNLSLFLNTQLATSTSNQLRGSFGRTRLQFAPLRDQGLIDSQFASSNTRNTSYLLNNTRLLNLSCFALTGAPANLPDLCGTLSGAGNSALARNRIGAYSLGAANQRDTVENNLGPVGQLIITPFSPLGIDPFLFPQGRANNTIQFADTVSLFRGNHTIETGADIRHSQLNSFLDRNFRPQVIFGGSFDFADALPLPSGARLPVEAQRLSRYGTTPGYYSGADLAAIGLPTGIFQSLSLGAPDSSIALRLWQQNFFVNDAWRVRPGLTLNFGLRFEYNTVPREANNRIERTFDLSRILPPIDPAFDFNFSDQDDTDNTRNTQLYTQAIQGTLSALSPFVSGREGIYNPDRNNFAPRVSFAWDPLAGSDKAGRMVIRGGAGIHYDVALGSVVSQSRNVFPTFIPFNVDVNTFNLSGPFVGATRRNNSIANASQIRARIATTPANEAAFRQAGCEFSNIEAQTGRVVYRCNLIQPGTLNTLGLPPGALQVFLGRLLNPAVARPQATPSSGSGLAFTLPDRNLKSPQMYHYNVQVERELFRDFLLNVGYVGSRGLSLTRFRTPNGGLNSPTALYDPLLLSLAQNGERLRPAIARPPLSSTVFGARPIAALGAFTIIDSSAASTYHSLQASVTKRFTRGWQMTAAYTWSHAIDDVSDVFDLAGAFTLPQDDRNLRLERGDANFDVRHRFVYSTLADVPFLSRFNNSEGAKGMVFGHWQFASISTYQTGQPFTVNTSFDVNSDGNLTDRLNTLNGLSFTDDRQQRLILNASSVSLLAANRQNGAVGRNTFRAVGILNTDFSLIKNFRLKEGQSLVFRTEVFNLWNRTHFAIPVRVLEAPAFGRSVDTSLPARQVQLALKYVF